MKIKRQSDLALLKQATKVGPHAVSSQIKLTVGLKLRNVAQLKRFLDDVQNPHSPSYRHFLAPQQFAARYGPAEADVKVMLRFLRKYGIKVRNVSPNRTLIHTEATTGAYEHAFEIGINDYKLNGRSFFSTMDSPKLPRTIAPMVANIIGLNNAVQYRPLHGKLRPFVFGENVPHEAPPEATTGIAGPMQIATAYDWPSLTDTGNGAGVTIAILSAESSDLSADDYNGFWSDYGLPGHSVTVIPVDGDEGLTGGTSETLLDIEWSGALAPGASHVVYVAADAYAPAFTDMYNRFVTDNLAQVMSVSWGLYESADPDTDISDNQIFMQAAAQGISMSAAAGDGGTYDEGPGANNADFPSSSPYIMSANGTQLAYRLDGSFVSETAWTNSGGAISILFDKPDWQTGPGVPENVGTRMNSDMAMNAVSEFLKYDGFWYSADGTSFVAPQIAGLFAVAVSQQPGGASLGQSNKLIYDDVNAENYASDFRDVITGCNGYLPDESPSCAGADWDHPTGWGSPLATSLLSHLGIQGPSGTLSGTVTDDSSGQPIADALISINPGNVTRLTGDDGGYSVSLATGNYTVSAAAFGYQTGSASVTIGDGTATTQDFPLTPASNATLSGRVTDGSGHGYGLYAEIKVATPGFGQVADVWTDPKNGNYSVALPDGNDYTLDVTAAFDGYTPGNATVTLAGDTTQNFALTVTDTCSAPGYEFVHGFGEDFNNGVPPAGWSMTTMNPLLVWMPSSSEPFDTGNYTGGTGDAADADSNDAGPTGPYDTSLITPPIPVTSLGGSTTLTYKANFQSYSDNNALDLDISTNGGNTWITLSHWTTGHPDGSVYSLPGLDVLVDLAPYLPSVGDFRLRWRYYNPISSYDFYAQIDDVAIGSCRPATGGLIYGQVTDSNTNLGLVGATVADDQGDEVETVVNPADANLPVGSYLFFAASGNRSLTASDDSYMDATARLTMTDNAVLTQNFALKAGHFTADPDRFTMYVMVNNTATAAIALANTGDGAASFKILSINAPPPGNAMVTGPFAPAPHYAARKNLSTRMAGGKSARRRVGTSSSRSWLSPNDDLLPNDDLGPHTAGDPVSSFTVGLQIYSLGVDHNASDLWLGAPFFGGAGGDDQDHRFLFDGTDTGDAINVMDPNVLYMADMAYDDVTGRIWQLSVDGPNGDSSHIVELNPTTMTRTGNSILVPSPQSERGLAFDPKSNTWFAGDFNSETVYHFDASGTLLDSAYVGLFITGMAYNSATGHLFVLTSGGIHAVYVLDAKNGYAQLSYFDISGFDPIYAGAGMGYDCGDHLWIVDDIKQTVWEADSGETSWCDFKRIPWLTVTPTAGTMAAGASVQVKLAFDGTGAEEFTTSQAYLRVTGSTPYPAPAIPMTVIWDPQPIHLALSGITNLDPIQKGNTLVYTLTVENRQADNHGAATQTMLAYQLPDGVSYVASSGDASCTVPPAGSSPAPAAATVSPLGTVTCDFGTIDSGASKTETIAVKVAGAGTLTSHFAVTAREPDDSDKNTLDIDTTVIGSADLSLSTSNATIPSSGNGTIKMTIGNAGPDTATDVKFKVTAGESAKLLSATSSAGSCAPVSGTNALSCDIGDVKSGNQVKIEITAFGAYAGTASVTGQVATSSNDKNSDNDVATATVTVKASGGGSNGGGGGGGGGALGWLVLAALLGLALGGVWARGRRG